MSSLLNQATAWKGQLPVEPKTLQFDPRDPLARYFAREIQSGIKLLRLVKKHLNELIDVCEGTVIYRGHTLDYAMWSRFDTFWTATLSYDFTYVQTRAQFHNLMPLKIFQD